MSATDILAGALAGGIAGVMTSGWVATRSERGRARETSRRSGRGVLASMGNTLKNLAISPRDQPKLLDRDRNIEFVRRLLDQSDNLGFMARHAIR
jgi:hypothetical protein